MSKSINGTGCDWHVDDHGFRPESYISDASKTHPGRDKDGINVWIALEDIPSVYGGGMAVSNGSHSVDWQYDAYNATGQNRSVDGGYTKNAILTAIEEKKRSKGEATLGGLRFEQSSA